MLKKMFTLLMAAMLVISMSSAAMAAVPACDHVPSNQYMEMVDPGAKATCGEDGQYSIFRCQLCVKYATFIDGACQLYDTREDAKIVIPATNDHNYENGECTGCDAEHACDFKYMSTPVEADCMNQGQEWWHCDCGKDDMRVIPKNSEHKFGEDGVCTNFTYVDGTRINCEEKKPDEHVCEFKYMAVSAHPDCVNEGQEWWHCDCGKDDMRTIAKDEDNHNFENGVCTRCGEEQELEFVPGHKPGHGHKPNKPNKPNKPHRPGKPAVKPERCRHEWAISNEVEANCTHEGSIVYVCAKGCGQEYTRTTRLNRGNHNYGEDNICDDCGKAKRCRHEWTVGDEVEANCTHEGSIVYVCAKGCGQEHTKTTEINPRKHNYGEDNVCDDCGKTMRSRRPRMSEETEIQTLEYIEETENQGFEYIEETENQGFEYIQETEETEKTERTSRRGSRNYRNREEKNTEYTEETESLSFEYIEETEETEETERARRRGNRNSRSRNSRSRGFQSDVYLTGND